MRAEKRVADIGKKAACGKRKAADVGEKMPHIDIGQTKGSSPKKNTRQSEQTEEPERGIVRFDRAGFTYDGETFVFRNLNLTVSRGEFVCVLGGNGSGKSTIAKHMNALLIPDEGSVEVLGLDTRDEGNLYFVRQNAGMVFQNPDDQLVASLVENDVAFGPENLGVPQNELTERVRQSLAEVGLALYGKHETNALSGGQKQRVAIAGVLAMQPQILILDEASAMLDPRGRRGLLRVCKELHERGMTIVMITHFMEEAALADRVVAVHAGEICLDGTPDEVLTQAEALENLNLEVPFACRLSLALQRRGVPVRTCVTETELKEELCRLYSTR